LIDLQLIEQCRGGDFNNFRKLVELTSPLVYSVAFRMLGNEDQAKDVVQDTMVTVWQKLKKIKTAEVYKTWVYRIAVNKCYDEMRKRKRNPEYIPDDQEWKRISDKISEGPSVALEFNDTIRIISMLTNSLGKKQKAVFILTDLEGMSGDEVSEIIGISKSSVKANLFHARKSISGKIEKYL
jgi:RNA polymerase sigma-70 factor, ECF subfamily